MSGWLPMRIGDRVYFQAPQCEPQTGTVVELRHGLTMGILVDTPPPHDFIFHWRRDWVSRLNIVLR